MKTYFFKRENNNFEDLLAEKCLKKKDIIKMFYYQHLVIVADFNDKELAYLTLKYGDEMCNPVVDYKPIPNVDYKVVKTY
jgi:hypothetical protein